MLEFEVRLAPATRGDQGATSTAIAGELAVKKRRPLAGAPVKDEPLGDRRAAQCFDTLRTELGRHRTQLRLAPLAPLPLAELRLAGHQLGDRAARALAAAFVRGTLHVGHVDLSRNQLGDAGAQALAQWLHVAPAPGPRALLLSQNFLSHVGAGLLLDAAVKCGHYPSTAETQSPAPFWLRLDRQRCPWPVLSGKGDAAQIEKAEQLLGHLAKGLTASCQAGGALPDRLPAGFQMFCIPHPPGCCSENGPSLTFLEHWPCNEGCCKLATKYGPMVHLPFFWAQDGTTADLPEEAKLHQQERGWRSWAPRRPLELAAKPKPLAPEPLERTALTDAGARRSQSRSRSPAGIGEVSREKPAANPGGDAQLSSSSSSCSSSSSTDAYAEIDGDHEASLAQAEQAQAPTAPADGSVGLSDRALCQGVPESAALPAKGTRWKLLKRTADPGVQRIIE